MNNEALCDVIEALEKMKFYRPIYEALLKRMSKQEALDAIKYLMTIEEL